VATDYISKGAEISACGRYRYLLWREWRGSHDPSNWRWLGTKDGAGKELGDPKSCLFIMLNPSTADGIRDDPTVRRCVAFARAWKFERMEIVNLFAFRATKPETLFRAQKAQTDISGPANQEYIERAAQDAGIIVASWGGSGRGESFQQQTMFGWLNENHVKKLHTLGFTNTAQPRHPLFVPANALPIPWRV
jgi:hypothetical protein